MRFFSFIFISFRVLPSDTLSVPPLKWGAQVSIGRRRIDNVLREFGNSKS